MYNGCFTLYLRKFELVSNELTVEYITMYNMTLTLIVEYCHILSTLY